MRDALVTRLSQRIAAYAEFVAALDPDDLARNLPVPRHKSAAEHLWCIVGARESYARALAAGAWQGFACSLQAYTHAHFEAALERSGAELLAAIANVDDWTTERDALLVAVAEHEVMHEGQLIRHMYGLERTLPRSWPWA